MQVLGHPEQAAGFDDGIGVAADILARIEVEGDAVAALRRVDHDGAHLAALAFEAKDVALVEIHAHYIGRPFPALP